MNHIINKSKPMDVQDDTRHETQQDGFSIDGEPLFEYDLSLQASTQNYQSKRTRAYTSGRTSCFVVLGWKLEEIQF
jgi:hypothetical protein